MFFVKHRAAGAFAALLIAAAGALALGAQPAGDCEPAARPLARLAAARPALDAPAPQRGAP
jgi:hypothetical protein